MRTLRPVLVLGLLHGLCGCLEVPHEGRRPAVREQEEAVAAPTAPRAHDLARAPAPRPVEPSASPATSGQAPTPSTASAPSSSSPLLEAPPTGAEALLPGGPVSLAEALRLALGRNPGLVALRRSEGVSEAALQVARTYPHNPQLGADVRPLTRERGGNNGDVLVAATLLQELELGGQGRHREATGLAEHEAAAWRVRDAEEKVLSEAARLFFDALHARERTALLESVAALQQETLDVTRRRFDAGLSSGTDIVLARMEAQSARQQADLARDARDAAVAALEQQLGLPPRSELVTSGALERAARSVAPTFLEDVIGERPDVRAAEADLAASAARARLAAAARVPNLTLGPVYERDESGTTFLGVEAQLPIPIWDTGSPLLRQRRAEEEQSREALRQLRVEASHEASAALARHGRAAALAQRFREDLFGPPAPGPASAAGATGAPGAVEAPGAPGAAAGAGGIEGDLQRIRDQYEAGQADIVQVFLARSNLLRARQAYLDALHEEALAAVDLTRAAGLSAATLLLDSPPRGASDSPGKP